MNLNNEKGYMLSKINKHLLIISFIEWDWANPVQQL